LSALLTIGSFLTACGGISAKHPSHTESTSNTLRSASLWETGTPQPRMPSSTSHKQSAPTTFALVPLVICPTQLGIPSSTTTVPESTHIAVNVAPVSASSVAIYSDSGGIMRLIAPRGWVCSGSDNADGSGEVVVYPPTQGLPSSWREGKWRLSSNSTAEAVVGMETSACVGCTLEQACTIFPSAARSLLRQYDFSCQPARPEKELLFRITANMVSFEDPAGVAGEGVPSGGKYPADGVVTYYPHDPNGSYLETCTLPPSERDICIASLNAFLDEYGNQ